MTGYAAPGDGRRQIGEERKMHRENEWGQPVGRAVDGFRGARAPGRESLIGTHCRLVPLDADRHAAALFQAYRMDAPGTNWTYLPYGPFESLTDYRDWVEANQANEDAVFFAILASGSEAPVGVAAYLRIFPETGSIEVGHLSYAPSLQRTKASTEAMYLMMRHAFEVLGYRRYEWKCDSLNEPSRKAARRLGFRYEGIFRNHLVMKGRNRDTAWFSITEEEWPAIGSALEAWLAPGNFGKDGNQRVRLADLMPPTAGTPIVTDRGETA